jgi:hypothetical protein
VARPSRIARHHHGRRGAAAAVAPHRRGDRALLQGTCDHALLRFFT